MGQTLPCRVARQLRCRDEPSAGDGRIWQHLRHRGSTRVSWVATASQRECGAGQGGAGGVWWVDLFGAGHDAGWGADGDPFHAANPRVIVKLNYAGSADLAAQILQGARVDIVATANTLHYEHGDHSRARRWAADSVRHQPTANRRGHGQPQGHHQRPVACFDCRDVFL